MHVIYLGISKSLLFNIVTRRLVDVDALSNNVDCLSVPHHFRRKPRNLSTELSLWKAQDHKNFLLYFSVFIFFGQFSTSNSEVSKQFLVLYMMLATSIYILSKPEVNDQDISNARRLISFFQNSLCRYFGDGVRLCSLHMLIHLPDQVKAFGPLTSISAAVFENVNRHFKRSVTGTKGQGLQMAERFLCFQADYFQPATDSS